MDIYISKRFKILASLKHQKKVTITHRKIVYIAGEKMTPSPTYEYTSSSPNNFGPFTDDEIQWKPLKYFKQFWSNEITDLLLNEANLYSAQNAGSSNNNNHAEIEQLIRIQMFMPVVKMPQYEMYWNNETRYKPIASIIPLKRYKKVREFSQVVDNAEKVKPETKSDTFFKVRTLFEAVRANCNKTEPEANHSLDEQIIPPKSKTSGGIC